MAVIDGRFDSRGPAGSSVERRRRRRLVYLVLGIIVLALVVVVLVVFQPQKLFIDDKVNEVVHAGVMTAGGGSAPGAGAQPAAPPSGGASGAFSSRAHGTSGTAMVLSMQDG